MKWGKFALNELFTFEIGKVIDGNKIDKVSGSTAYVTRRESNNGLDGFIDYNDTSYINTKYPVITIGNETAEPFVHTYPFYTGTKVNILSPRVKTSQYALMFIARCFKVQKHKYSYAFTANTTRLKSQTIQLPVDSSGQPDWSFMENYMRERERLLASLYKVHESRVSESVSLEGVRWGEFFISDVTEIISGRGIFDDERIPGNTPYITASAVNNGVSYFLSNTNETLEANCISVNSNGSVGYAFYHPYEALYSGDCRKLRPNVRSKNVSIFIARQITAQKDKYSYGYKMGTARLRRQKILLPIDSQGQPDYSFMEEFIRHHERRLIESYSAYRNFGHEQRGNAFCQQH